VTQIVVEVDISVSGAALGGLQRYVSVQPLELEEGGKASIEFSNLNFSAVSDFIALHQRGKSTLLLS